MTEKYDLGHPRAFDFIQLYDQPPGDTLTLIYLSLERPEETSFCDDELMMDGTRYTRTVIRYNEIKAIRLNTYTATGADIDFILPYGQLSLSGLCLPRLVPLLEQRRVKQMTEISMEASDEMWGNRQKYPNAFCCLISVSRPTAACLATLGSNDINRHIIN